MWWWFSVMAMAAEVTDVACPEAPVVEARAAAEAVERSWLSLDGPGFEVARARVERMLPCVSTVVSTEDAMALHKARAITAFVDGDTEASQRAFLAVLALDPTWTPDEDAVPTEHPLWRVYEAAAGAEPAADVPFHVLPAHGWAVDGVRFPRAEDPRDADGVLTGAYGLPSNRAFVLQILDPRRVVTYTGYHLSIADVPVRDISLRLQPGELRRRRRQQARIWGSVIGGAMLAAGATTFGVAWTERTKLENGTASVLEVEELQARANTLGGMSYGLAGAGTAVFALAWSIPW